MLENVGLATRDQNVYRTLLLHPRWKIDDIQQHLGLPEEEVRTALDRLASLSLLRPSTDVNSFVTTNPEIELKPVFERMEAELDEQRAKLFRDRAMAAALAADYTALRLQTGAQGLERIEGLDNVRIRLQELARSATSEVRAFMPGGALSPGALEAARPLDENTLARGVRMQTIHLDSVRNDHPTVEYATWFTARGGQTRTVPSLPMRLILCDRSIAVIPVNREASQEGAFVIHLSSVVAALSDLFDLVWDRATPLGDVPVLHCDGPSDRDLTILKMLEDGFTDEGIARKLGISIRTVRRLMADLLRRLNAQSRFQAGAEAVRLGWL
ncbi:helix-turn-helix domain-containing protein [Streptomyces sp. SID12501]|uniref:Helix-turn-helix transcriptional regulator n=1 Tax=Streptomyces sp. SID12501 TaxID=2706042 RepID=A0A6B3BVP9_9ACTN|nr:helix-turn-helix domain-containing protein [Streptomyces sp. SID12501]NEC88372.1 helix-turn-helix transcriptional regulator [Streptomyces sp. SID12501]